MIFFEVSPERTEYISQEEVEVLVRIVNNEAVPIEIPDPDISTSAQPTYTLTGPGYPKGITCSNLSLSQETDEEVISGTEALPRLIMIRPGESWEGVFSISSALDLSLPGEYRLRSRLEWQGLKAESKEKSFRIGPMALASIHLGLGVRPLEYGEGEGAFIHRGADSNQLYAFSYLEDHPGISEANLNPPINRLTVGLGATDVAVPWRNSPFFNESVQWLVWREGRSVKALHNASTTPVSYDLPDEPACLVKPPLKTTGGPVEVLALFKEKKELYLVRFADYRAQEDPPVRLALRATLPVKPHSITAALAPEQQGSDRHIAFTAKHKDGFAILHSRYTENGPIGAFQSVNIATGRLIDNAPLALFVDSESKAHVSVLSITEVTKEKMYRCALVEARFEASGPMEPEITDLGVIRAKPVSGAVLYVDKENRVARREVVISLEDNRILRLNASGQMVSVSAPGRPTTPMLLTPGEQMSYLLCFDPNRGLFLQPL